MQIIRSKETQGIRGHWHVVEKVLCMLPLTRLLASFEHDVVNEKILRVFNDFRSP